MVSLPCIASLRPLSEDCPSLIKSNGKFLYPTILKELLRQNIFSEVLLSVAPDTPQKFIDIITSWELPCEIGTEMLPNTRTAAAALARHWNTIACISAYTLFYDAEFIHKTAGFVQSGIHDFSGAETAISNMEFSILNDKTIHFMSTLERSLVPSKPQALLGAARDVLRHKCIQDAYSPTEEFFWLMQYAGSIAVMPIDFITSFYERHAPDQWFVRSCRERHTVDYFNIPDIHCLDTTLTQGILPFITQSKLVGQLRWIERFLPEFPESGERYLELGYGQLPLISHFLSSRFASSLALEPGFESPPTHPELGELFSHAGSFFSYLNDHRDSPRGSLQMENKTLEELELESESIDFCTSKMVFEHVQDVPGTSRELYRVLRPGATMLHEIGLNDHTGGTSSGIHFTFLKYSREQWTKKWKGTNLYRINDFIALWEEFGFKVEVVSKVVSSNIPAIINKSWFSYPLEDLLCQTAVVRAKKPAS